MAATGGAKTIITAFIANFCIAIAKLFGFFITSSSAMLAESIHSFADTSNQALLLLGRKRSKKLPSSERPFGFGRERFFWAFVVSLVLFSLTLETLLLKSFQNISKTFIQLSLPVVISSN